MTEPLDKEFETKLVRLVRLQSAWCSLLVVTGVSLLAAISVFGESAFRRFWPVVLMPAILGGWTRRLYRAAVQSSDGLAECLAELVQKRGLHALPEVMRATVWSESPVRDRGCKLLQELVTNSRNAGQSTLDGSVMNKVRSAVAACSKDMRSNQTAPIPKEVVAGLVTLLAPHMTADDVPMLTELAKRSCSWPVIKACRDALKACGYAHRPVTLRERGGYANPRHAKLRRRHNKGGAITEPLDEEFMVSFGRLCTVETKSVLLILLLAPLSLPALLVFVDSAYRRFWPVSLFAAVVGIYLMVVLRGAMRAWKALTERLAELVEERGLFALPEVTRATVSPNRAVRNTGREHLQELLSINRDAQYSTLDNGAANKVRSALLLCSTHIRRLRGDTASDEQVAELVTILAPNMTPDDVPMLTELANRSGSWPVVKACRDALNARGYEHAPDQPDQPDQIKAPRLKCVAGDILALASDDEALRTSAASRLAALPTAEFKRLLVSVRGLDGTVRVETMLRRWAVFAVAPGLAALFTPRSVRVIPIFEFMPVWGRFHVMWMAMAVLFMIILGVICGVLRGAHGYRKPEWQPLQWPAFTRFLSELRAPHLVPCLIAALPDSLTYATDGTLAVQTSLARMLPAIEPFNAGVLGRVERNLLRNHIRRAPEWVISDRLEAAERSVLMAYIRGAVIALTTIGDARAREPMQALLTELCKTSAYPELMAALETGITWLRR